MESVQAKQRELDRIRRSLTNQTPTENTIHLIENLRTTATSLAARIIGVCEPSRERSLALTHLEETVMWAVKGLVLHRAEPEQQ